MERDYNRVEPVRIENVEGRYIWKRNFAGVREEMNDEGNRYFLLTLPTELGEAMLRDGWLVKKSTYNDEESYYISVKVNFGRDGNRPRTPPRVWRVCGKKRRLLTEDDIADLDSDVIIRAGMTLNPYHGRNGISRYFKSGRFEVEEDYFDKKYEDYEIEGAGPRVEDDVDLPF